MPTGTAVLDFGSGSTDASVAVTGQTGIVSGSLVEAWIRPVASADHSADEHLLEEIKIVASDIVAGTGFTVRGYKSSDKVETPLGWLSSGQNLAGKAGGVLQLRGQFNVNWAWN
jgi:hypothetical protein